MKEYIKPTAEVKRIETDCTIMALSPVDNLPEVDDPENQFVKEEMTMRPNIWEEEW